jgi:glutamate--cysteine ligase
MREVLPARGRYALDMMLMTSTGQVSLDWESEEDCAKKMTLASRLSPLLVALYANSPIVQGRPSGFASFRSHVWTDVDRARSGFFPAMVDGTFSYQAYVEWALDAPILFLRRDGKYLTTKLSFRQFMKDGFEGKPALEADWADHLSTLFPEVRIKKVLEIRSADSVSLPLTGALLALFRGLLYDEGALHEALGLLPRVAFEEHQVFMEVARREGLLGRFRRRALWEWGKELVGIAREGLKRLDSQDVALLEPLAAQAESRASPAAEVERLHRSGAGPGELLAHFAL